MSTINNPVLEAIANRRTTRGFADTPLTQEQLDALMAAATASPSAINLQSWHFTFCSDQSAITELEQEVNRLIMSGSDEGAKQRMMARNGKAFYNAPTVIFISSDAQSVWSALDAGIAAENLALAAYSMGLGSVIIGMCKRAFEGENGAVFAEKLHFPEGHKFSLAVAVGVPTVTKEAHPVGDNKITVM